MEDAFGSRTPFALGIEDELLLVDSETLALVHNSTSAIDAVGEIPAHEGQLAQETHAAIVECKSPVAMKASDAVSMIAQLRQRLVDSDRAIIAAGLHPSAAFGDSVVTDAKRYSNIATEMRGITDRGPMCATHVHVSMPDRETAISCYNGLRYYLPLLQALSANSPFWYGEDSGFASARSLVCRQFPRTVIPRAFASWDDYIELIEAWDRAADCANYTFLWWDIRPHPLLGSIELRAMDAQTNLRNTMALAALIQSLAYAIANGAISPPEQPTEVVSESSFRAARDGLEATIYWDGSLTPVRTIISETLAAVAPHARALNTEEELAEIERITSTGNGATVARAAYDRGGIRGVLTSLHERSTSQSYAI